ncbi:MAG: PIN domain nuclease [Acidobacteria bacterium]|nr:MAG: PIN domain nuclease [Acidobacteriota bacterium]
MGIDLKEGDVVFLDTAPFIYYFEKHPNYFPLMQSLMDRVYALNIQVVTSAITYIEIAIYPARLGQNRLVAKYRDFFNYSENIHLLPLDLVTSDCVVRLRAEYGFKTPDAVQLGTAVVCGADYIVTNDRAWKKFRETRVVMVEELGDLL